MMPVRRARFGEAYHVVAIRISNARVHSPDFMYEDEIHMHGHGFYV
jgi:hypothetical protein